MLENQSKEIFCRRENLTIGGKEEIYGKNVPREFD